MTTGTVFLTEKKKNHISFLANGTCHLFLLTHYGKKQNSKHNFAGFRRYFPSIGTGNRFHHNCHQNNRDCIISNSNYVVDGARMNRVSTGSGSVKCYYCRHYNCHQNKCDCNIMTSLNTVFHFLPR